jgi:hypothetical protein
VPEDPDPEVDGALGVDDPLEDEPSPPDEDDEDDEPESLEDEDEEDVAAGTVADEPERLSVR